MSNSKVFVTTYALYNEGLQFKNNQTGFWLDTANYDVETLIANFVAQGDQDPELMFTDYEGFPESLYSESGMDFDLINEYDELDDDEQKVVEYLIDHLGYDIKSALDKHEDVNVHDCSAHDYVYGLVDEYYDLPDLAKTYFDYDAFARDLLIEGDIAEHDGLLFSGLLSI
jgi:antirestriction protein